MGDVEGRATHAPQAIERHLPWGVVLRGVRRGNGPDVALLLHEPRTDVDAWGLLPFEIARQLQIETVAVDLPGHGLSDDPWEPERLPDLLRNLPDITTTAGRRFLIVAADTAIAALEQAATLDLSGLVCLSPTRPGDGWHLPRSPGVPKLLAAGSIAGSDLREARQLATACGGWAVVTSYPVTDRGTQILASPWGDRLIEEIIAFLRDCLRHPLAASIPTGRMRPASQSAPHNNSPSPSALGEGLDGEGVRGN